jgi:hypothetical protein
MPLVFVDINSPRTAANLRHNPAVEINVVDALARKGYRFKGTGAVLTEGPLCVEVVAAYRGGSTRAIRQIVPVRVERAAPLVSPVYATGASEAEVGRTWAAYYRSADPVPGDADAGRGASGARAEPGWARPRQDRPARRPRGRRSLIGGAVAPLQDAASSARRRAASRTAQPSGSLLK